MSDALREINQAECREYIDLYTTYAARAERAEAEVERLQAQVTELRNSRGFVAAENGRLRDLLTNAVLLMRPGTDLCKRTLTALGNDKPTTTV